MRTILITGASSGVGRATAELFAGHGWTVGVLARRAALLDEIADSIGALPLVADVTDPAAVQAAFAHFVATAGRIDVLFNNAGIFPKAGTIDEITPEDWNAAVLKEIVGRIARSGLASPLAVIKRMGEGRAGMLSFPMEGYTLAIDFPARDKAEALIKELETMTLEADGRLYLGKDALATGDRIKAMYPEWQAWAAEAAKADPEGLLITDIVRRLQLREVQQ